MLIGDVGFEDPPYCLSETGRSGVRLEVCSAEGSTIAQDAKECKVRILARLRYGYKQHNKSKTQTKVKYSL